MKKLLISMLFTVSIQSGFATENTTGNKNTNNRHADISEKSSPLNSHVLKIRSAVQSKFYNYDEFSGRKCSIKIRIAKDGRIESISDITGDPGLCDAVKKVMDNVTLPRPDSDDIWLQTNNVILRFEP
ncbi:TPA: hypothetical protein PC598_001848 [Morganella morganii]|nr:hypothetical protein [Morganella morganii]